MMDRTQTIMETHNQKRVMRAITDHHAKNHKDHNFRPHTLSGMHSQ